MYWTGGEAVWLAGDGYPDAGLRGPAAAAAAAAGGWEEGGGQPQGPEWSPQLPGTAQDKKGKKKLAICLIQGWEFSHSLRSLKSNERLWAIHSGQMSNCERIAQIAHVKRAICSGCSWKMSDSLKIFWTKIVFFVHFLYVKKKPERFAHSLFFNERCEQIAQVAH